MPLGGKRGNTGKTCIKNHSHSSGGDSVAVCCCWLCRVIDSCQRHSSLPPPSDLEGLDHTRERAVRACVVTGWEAV